MAFSLADSRRWWVGLALVALAGGWSRMAAGGEVTLPEWPGAQFGTGVTVEKLDAAAFTEWVDGAERKIGDRPGRDDNRAEWVLGTATTMPGHSGVVFGESRNPGPRHLRIGFTEGVPVGTVFADDGGRVSVLKPEAKYPGDPANEADWIPAERQAEEGESNGSPVTQAEAMGKGALALWVLPPGTVTRALRFTHVAKAADEGYAGELSGALVLPQRLVNEAGQARAGSSTRAENAPRLVNGLHDGWEAWANEAGGEKVPGSQVVSAEHPQWVTLAWQEPVTLDGLVAVWAGIAVAEVQSYVGPEGGNPADAAEQDWQTVNLYRGLQHRYATRFWPNRLDFGKPVKTRAVRVKILDTGEARSHAGNNDGHRTWLGELLAVRALADGQPLAGAVRGMGAPQDGRHAPVPVKFHLAEAGYVTLVVERPDGFRVRNLVSETWFPAGDNTAWWDGTDDLGRDADAANHGVYQIPARLVEAGGYRVRGLVRGAIVPRYEFTVYAPGDPPWSTEDSTGGWLANHSPPQAAVFVPGEQSPTGQPVVYLGCYVTEGPAGVAWVDLDGKKLGGKKWIGGNWTAAPFLARDAGAGRMPDVQVYAASAWTNDAASGQMELRVTALTKGGDRPVLKYGLGEIDPVAKGEQTEEQLGGLAVNNGKGVVALTKRNQLLVFEVTGATYAPVPVESPRGLAFDPQGRLLVISGKRVLRYALGEAHPKLVPLIERGLEEPVGITVDAQGLVYVSDHGNSHQVKVFSPSGRPLRAIGKAGKPEAGPYDPLHMNHPMGLAVDSRQQLWVTEHDYLPKRVSVWSADGKLLRAFYGPGKYGGGGTLDPQDRTRFYYSDEGRGTLEFRLDWDSGASRLANVLYRPGPGDLALPRGCSAPETPLYYKGSRYLTNCHTSNPTGGAAAAFLFSVKGAVARPVAGMGRAEDWPVLGGEGFRPRWPQGMQPGGKEAAFFVWSDLNGDAQAQPEEVAIQRGRSGGVTVMDDLSFCIARLEGQAVRFAPVRVTADGVPVYDAAQPAVLAREVLDPQSSGGDQALAGADGWSVVTLGMQPFDPLSVSGAKDGVAKWSYPTPWPGLHASHHAPRPDRPGQLIGSTRLAGGFFRAGAGDALTLWPLHTNHGRLALFTDDGLFVGNLFDDMRGGKTWKMPAATRGMDLEGVTLGEENFWPTLTRTADGKVYVVDGGRSAIVRLDGLESLRRLPDAPLELTAADLEQCRAWRVEAEALRQKAAGSGRMRVATGVQGMAVDGKLDDWAGAAWVDIDKSGVAAYFDANNRPYDITGAVAVSGDRLHAAWRTGRKEPLKNSGEMPLAPFKTGDALDLMIGPDGDRTAPGPGDMRLVVSVVNGQPRALLYRPVVPGTPPEERVPFSSPWRTITFDRVEDVTDRIAFAWDSGNGEISVPLELLGIRPEKGTRLRGDIGVLRGDGGQTQSRTYWSNKATGIVSDVPEEAMLTPGLWGTWEFE